LIEAHLEWPDIAASLGRQCKVGGCGSGS
jgi:hypothetical protein